MVLPPSSKVLAQEPVQLDRTMYDSSLVDFVLLAPSSLLLSVDVTSVTMRAMLLLRRPATAASVLFSSGAGSAAVPPLGEISCKTFAYKGGHLDANIQSQRKCATEASMPSIKRSQPLT
jgi:hypothetical protein